MSNQKRAGFTLIELLVVIAIIAILVAIGVTAFSSARNSANISRRKAILKDVDNALGQYKIDNGTYPVYNIANANRNTSFENDLAPYLTNQDLPDDDFFNYRADSDSYCLIIIFGSDNQDQSNCHGNINNPPGTCNFDDPDTDGRWCIQSKF